MLFEESNMINCTILIPTYNRPNYLKRILSYYHKYGRNFEIIVADSSSNENKMLNSKNILSLPNNNILYLKYPTDIKPFCEKVPDALKYIKTKYCVSCADDDFVIPNAIKESINFLEKNPDFSCIQGHYISFYLRGNYLPAKKFIYTPIYTNYKSNIFKNAKDRLFSNFLNYMHTIYSVHRTNFLKMIFGETIKFTDDDIFGELLPSMLDLISGKMKKLDVLYSARELIPNSWGRRTSENLLDFIKNSTYDDKYAKFRKCLVKALVSKEDISKEKAQKLVDKAMNQYLGSSISKLELKAGLKRIIERNALLKEFYHVYRRFNTSKKQISVSDRLPAIEYDNQENPYYEDFIRIKEVVEKGITE